MKSPDGKSRNCVVCSKGTRWICWGCTIDLGDIFPVCPIEKRPECFANMHRMRTEIWVSLSFQLKKFVLYLHSKSNKVIYVLIKEHFDVTDERILTQNWSRASPCKVMFRDTFSWFLLDNCQNLAVCITRCARALDGARTHNGAHTVFEFSEVQTQSLYEECVTLHNNPFHFFFYMIKITHFSRFWISVEMKNWS